MLPSVAASKGGSLSTCRLGEEGHSSERLLLPTIAPPKVVINRANFLKIGLKLILIVASLKIDPEI